MSSTNGKVYGSSVSEGIPTVIPSAAAEMLRAQDERHRGKLGKRGQRTPAFRAQGYSDG